MLIIRKNQLKHGAIVEDSLDLLKMAVNEAGGLAFKQGLINIEAYITELENMIYGNSVKVHLCNKCFNYHCCTAKDYIEHEITDCNHFSPK